jgi:hypothetical protein
MKRKDFEPIGQETMFLNTAAAHYHRLINRTPTKDGECVPILISRPCKPIIAVSDHLQKVVVAELTVQAITSCVPEYLLYTNDQHINNPLR